jgi:hypothetical protein
MESKFWLCMAKILDSARKVFKAFSVYRKIVHKSILTESTTILIALVDDRHKCKGPERKPTPPSQSSVMGCADKPFYYEQKEHTGRPEPP